MGTFLKSFIFFRYNVNVMKQLTAVIRAENNWFVAENPETGVASQGKTEREALANLSEAVSLYLEEAEAPAIQKVTIKPLIV